MTSNKQIAFLSPGWPLKDFPNGIVSYIQYLRDNLNDGFNSIVLSSSTVGESDYKPDVLDLTRQAVDSGLVDKIQSKLLYALPKLGVMAPAYKYKWKKHALRIASAIDSLPEDLDLIEIEDSFGLAAWLKPHLSSKIITRLHGPWFIHGPIMKQDTAPFYQSRLKYEGVGIEASDAISSPSLDVLNRVREYYDLELSDAHVIPNPVPEVNEDFRWNPGENARPNILFVGRFDLHKGGDLVIRAFRELASKYGDLILDFVGPDRGVMIDNSLVDIKAYMNSHVPEASIRKRIHFHGHISGQKLEDLRRTSLVTVVASRYETFSISMVEGLSYGSPIVASSVGAIPEIIKNDFNGLLAEPDSAESLANMISVLLDDSDLREKLSKNAYEDVKKRLYPEVVAQQTLAFYDKVLHGQG